MADDTTPNGPSSSGNSKLSTRRRCSRALRQLARDFSFKYANCGVPVIADANVWASIVQQGHLAG